MVGNRRGKREGVRGKDVNVDVCKRQKMGSKGHDQQTREMGTDGRIDR